MIWDVITVGAGPAGSATAFLLAKKGYQVLLLDKATFPREKLCGEYLSPGAMEVLDRLGALKAIREVARPIRGMRLVSPDGTTFVACHPPETYGLALSRRTLDHLLLMHAKRGPLTCLERFRVEGLLLENGQVVGVRGRGPEGPAHLRGRLVIGADGRNSIVARHLRLFRWHPSHRKMVLAAHYEGVEAEEGYGEVFIGRSVYGILNPLGNGLINVNLVLDQEGFAPTKRRLEASFGEVLQGLPGLVRRLKGGKRIEGIRALGPLAHQAIRVSWDGALLVGDAAGFFDPFTGEGVYMALRGAELAAEVADEALRRDDLSVSFLRRYDKAWRRAFRARFRLEALIQWLIARPSLANFVARHLQVNQEAASPLMAVIGDLLPPEELLSFGFLARCFLANARPEVPKDPSDGPGAPLRPTEVHHLDAG